MVKRALTVALVVLLFTGVAFVNVAMANFIPEPIPSGIVIEADGSVTGTDLIERKDNTYRFKGDTNGSLVVMRDNITIDGAGYTLVGDRNSTGVFLQQRANVIVENLQIKNFFSAIKLSFGLSMSGGNGIRISNNVLTNNTHGIVLGLFSGNITVSNNVISGNKYGIYFSYSSGNVLRNNSLSNNQYNMWVDCELSNSAYTFVNDIDQSNSVNGKPIYYWVNQHDRTVPEDAGFVALVMCSNITIENLSLSNNGQGILLVTTNNSIIKSNQLANNNYGIVLFGPYVPCTGNMIIQNKISSNAKDSIYSWNNNQTTITNNSIINNQANGINLYQPKQVTIIGNNISNNVETGIRLWGYESAGPQTISDNYISKNALGLHLDWDNSADNIGGTITGNTFVENNGAALKLSGEQQNNQIYLNSFVDNNVSGLQVSQPGRWTAKGNLPAKHNEWDNGTLGNYWSDYQSRYPNASEIGTTGTGNTPFYINENNIDHYPLMSPVETMAHSADSSETLTLSMPKEYLNYTITEVNGVLWATVDGNYPMHLSPVQPLPMVYPIPPNTTDIHIKLDGVELEWTNYSAMNPTETHHTVIGEWQEIYTVVSPAQADFLLQIHYRHPVEVINGSYTFLYDLNIAGYLSPASPTSIAYFKVDLPQNYTDVTVFRADSEKTVNYTVTNSSTGTTVTFDIVSQYDTPLEGDIVFVLRDSSVPEFSIGMAAAVLAGVSVITVAVGTRKKLCDKSA